MFSGCYVEAFHFFGGVPASIRYNGAKTVVKRHVAPGEAVPLHLPLDPALAVGRWAESPLTTSPRWLASAIAARAHARWPGLPDIE